MILDKYKMSNERVVYCYTTIELVRRGYSRKNARSMVMKSNIIQDMNDDPAFFFHYGPQTWADWVIDRVSRYDENKLMMG